MRLGYCSATNFGSYNEFEIDFRNQGLTLVHGATGAGKSTFMDVPLWCLTGKTAKDGQADDVKSWQDPEANTTAVLEVETNQGSTIVVTRIRGGKHSDLFWVESERPDSPVRGKDVKDTQRLLEARLGIDLSLYTTASYYSEFSDSAHFFLASAKDRRALLEKLADLSLATKLADRTTAARKALKKDIATTQSTVSRKEGGVETLIHELDRNETFVLKWKEKHKEALIELKIRCDNFEEEIRTKIEALYTKSDAWENNRKIKAAKAQDKYNKSLAKKPCPTCGMGGATDTVDLLETLTGILEETNPYENQINETSKIKNTYGEQLEKANKEKNPFEAKHQDIKAILENTKLSLDKAYLAKLEAEFEKNLRLYDLTPLLRGIILQNAIDTIQDKTNRYLEKFFDGAFRVEFKLIGDDLEVEIRKDGYQCNFKQLSKGQRRLLVLCFSVSVMAQSSNNSGVDFGQLFLDESLDGMDTELKVKAYRLFQELEKYHDSIFVIDHATELKEMFCHKYRVELVGDYSQVVEES